MLKRTIFNRLFTFLFCLFLVNISFAEPTIEEGKSLFKTNCAQCHNRNMKDDLTGPALGGVQERWDGREEVLYSWIRNSQAVIASGDSYANDLYNKWNKSLMNPFPNLTDDQIVSILSYIQCTYDGSCAPKSAVAGPATGDGADAGGSGISSKFLYITLLGILGILALVLTRIVSNLNYIVQKKDADGPLHRKTMWESLTSKGVITFLIFAFILFGGYTTINQAIKLNRQQGYAPQQPIKFSHETHAGLHKIDCQYCHDGARRSKHSVIPAANTCMNCHKAIKKGSSYGTAEISKIYASIGYNPTKDMYIEDYDQMPQDSIKAFLGDWIATNYMKENEIEERNEDVEEVVEEQWSDIVSSLTNEQKKTVQGPIEWVRVHNLPDHAYFNHAQHVTVGGIECQQCHGPVEEMELVQQYAPLSMGWCINCHRETEVNFTDNNYYDSYKKYHDEIKEGKRTKVTVEDIGGLECQKCHY